MADVALKVESRKTEEVGKELRKQGQVPAVVYGLGKDTASVKMGNVEFEKAFRVSGYSTLIDLDIDGKSEKVLVKEIDYHPVSDDFIHIDFIRVDMNKEITTDVALVFEGTAPAVKNEGCIISTPKDSVEVRCLPANLIHDIVVSLDGLEVTGDSVHIRDLQLPEGIEILDDENLVLVQAMATRGDEEEEEAEMSSPDDVEVPGEKKDEEGGEGGEGGDSKKEDKKEEGGGDEKKSE